MPLLAPAPALTVAPTEPRRLSEEQWAGVRRVLAAADVTIPLERLDEVRVRVRVRVRVKVRVRVRVRVPT